MKQYLKENPFNGGEKNIASVLNYLTICYLEDHPVSSKPIKVIEEEMEPYYENIPLDISNQLFNKVYSLCRAYEETAFREGLLVGLHLYSEICNP